MLARSIRPLLAAIVGLIAVALLVLAVIASLHQSSASRTAQAAPRPAQTYAGELKVQSLEQDPKKAEARASGPSKYSDVKALTYFKEHWDDATGHRITDIRTAGRYLRIYTNLPEGAHNSKAAITLCKRGLQYLRDAGESYPIVFVQARFGENGNPVLANILGPDDDSCRLTSPAPGG
ncbi:hypothetical protein J5X84_18830 [Streptosporangiaceae bacterium NEAU-GS5]|nr:hypothetical protein [Streptosporangiaceae bacterium NEAU-GS5]